MKIKIKSALFVLANALVLSGCYEDKGNYTYGDLEVIDVTFPDVMEAMQGGTIAFAPTVTSSSAGVIKNGNDNYEYTCLISYSYYDDERNLINWTDINPGKSKDFNFVASIPANIYTVWYKVKNKSTGIESNFKSQITVKSATSEGWMVLSNNGADKKGRLDIIYTDPDGNDCVFADVKDINSVEIFNARGLVMSPSVTTANDQIFLLAESGSYRLNRGKLTAYASDNIKNIEFNTPTVPGSVIAYTPLLNKGYSPTTRLAVTTLGDVYGVHEGSTGAAFEHVMNSAAPGNLATYKVAPAIGVSLATGSYCGLFYDITNKRFMGSCYSYAWGQPTPIESKTLFTLVEPEEPLFSFDTGMDFVDMANTAFSDGDCFTILQDASGNRHVYVINLAGYTRATSFKQRALYSNINAENFNSATDYAAHSQYTFLFYCLGNKVYCYNYATGVLTDAVTLGPDETASLVKFNRFSCLRLNAMVQMNKTDEEFVGLQNELIVGSSNGQENGGKMRLYKISPQGKMTLHKEFSGLGEEIVDIVYRERHIYSKD